MFHCKIAIVYILILFTLISCNKSDDNVPNTYPTMTGISVNGSEKVYTITIFFNDGVYRNTNRTGDLDERSFKIELTGGTAKMSSYLVSHVAGQKNAAIRISFDSEPNLEEIVTIYPADDEAIYNANGYAMDDNEYKSIGLDGVTHETIIIKDNGEGTGTTTFTSNNIYILDGFVFVNEGQILTIEAGTVIKANSGLGENASALIVARGGKIIANGDSLNPIIFTSVYDDLNGSISDLSDGLWGGVIVLGNAKINSNLGEDKIEGIPDTEPRGIYGGNNDQDNSGILRYISIRYGGTDIGEGNEINGLTLGGVGSETVIEFIEVFSNKDDGVEIFGGAVRMNNIIAAFCRDDAFDFDQGYHGKGQFWIGVQGFNRGDRIGEHDGCSESNCSSFTSNPTIYNVTYTGRYAGGERQMVTFRNNSAGQYANSIFYQQYAGMDIEYNSNECSYDQLQNGQLILNNNIFFNISYQPIFHVSAGPNITTEQEESANMYLSDYFLASQNEVKDPGFIIEGLTFNLIPENDVSTNLANYPPDDWFKEVDYKGAFDPQGINWAKNWSLFSKYMD